MSERKQDAAARRDFRHTHDEGAPAIYSKKNTALWCRGRVGVAHEWRPLRTMGTRWMSKLMVQQKCDACGKLKWALL